MRGHWGLRCLKWCVLGVFFVLGIGLLVQTLWNALMPAIFSLPVLSFAQGLGLLVLARLLVGGFGRHGGGCGHYGWRYRMSRRWESLSPEEKEKFRQSFASCCGPWEEEKPEKTNPA